MAAYRLAEAGGRVLLLDRGKAYPPGAVPHRRRRGFLDTSEGLQAMTSRRHVRVGTDFAGFIKPTLGGVESPSDLRRLEPALSERYGVEDSEAICSGSALGSAAHGLGRGLSER